MTTRSSCVGETYTKYRGNIKELHCTRVYIVWQSLCRAGSARFIVAGIVRSMTDRKKTCIVSCLNALLCFAVTSAAQVHTRQQHFQTPSRHRLLGMKGTTAKARESVTASVMDLNNPSMCTTLKSAAHFPRFSNFIFDPPRALGRAAGRK